MSVGSSEALDQVLFYNLEETNVKFWKSRPAGISSPEILPWSDRSDTSCDDECCIWNLYLNVYFLVFISHFGL